MKAVRYYGARDVRIERIDPPVPKDGEVLVQVLWCGLCGSDLKNYTLGPYGAPTYDEPEIFTGDTLPITLGHEACGRVVEAAAGCPFKVQQAVMIDPRLYCSKCPPCMSGATHICDKRGILSLSGGGGGGFSEYMAVDWPLVLGGGPIGLAAIHNLRALGMKQIFVTEPTTTRQRQCAPFVTAALDPKACDPAAEILSQTSGKGVDLVLDCAGVASAFEVGPKTLRKRGQYVMIAGWEKPLVVPQLQWMSKEITMIPSVTYDEHDFREVVDDFVAGKFKGVEEMITGRIKLDEIVTHGLEELLQNRDNHVKILVEAK